MLISFLFDAGSKAQQRKAPGDTFEVYQDDMKSKKQGTAARAQGIAGLQQSGRQVKQVKPKTGMEVLLVTRLSLLAAVTACTLSWNLLVVPESKLHPQSLVLWMNMS